LIRKSDIQEEIRSKMEDVSGRPLQLPPDCERLPLLVHASKQILLLQSLSEGALADS